ncbi:uncharacterized protein LOC142225500 [Haematobia irritans]|uniref:uncharacterized protein LOC142225500 n=1 Tax=Haematobia irritans TaxID=7368 RepID=UPI003F5033A2
MASCKCLIGCTCNRNCRPEDYDPNGPLNLQDRDEASRMTPNTEKDDSFTLHWTPENSLYSSAECDLDIVEKVHTYVPPQPPPMPEHIIVAPNNTNEIGLTSINLLMAKSRLKPLLEEKIPKTSTLEIGLRIKQDLEEVSVNSLKLTTQHGTQQKSPDQQNRIVKHQQSKLDAIPNIGSTNMTSGVTECITIKSEPEFGPNVENTIRTSPILSEDLATTSSACFLRISEVYSIADNNNLPNIESGLQLNGQETSMNQNKSIVETTGSLNIDQTQTTFAPCSGNILIDNCSMMNEESVIFTIKSEPLVVNNCVEEKEESETFNSKDLLTISPTRFLKIEDFNNCTADCKNNASDVYEEDAETNINIIPYDGSIDPAISYSEHGPNQMTIASVNNGSNLLEQMKLNFNQNEEYSYFRIEMNPSAYDKDLRSIQKDAASLQKRASPRLVHKEKISMKADMIRNKKKKRKLEKKKNSNRKPPNKATSDSRMSSQTSITSYRGEFPKPIKMENSLRYDRRSRQNEMFDTAVVLPRPIKLKLEFAKYDVKKPETYNIRSLQPVVKVRRSNPNMVNISHNFVRTPSMHHNFCLTSRENVTLNNSRQVSDDDDSVAISSVTPPANGVKRNLLLEIAAQRAFINYHLTQFGYSPIQFELYNDENSLNNFLKYLLGQLIIKKK